MDKFVVYKSSAGSGKTFTLVREYIALALKSPSYFRHILAITFTNKAANEMKQRVVQSLVHLSAPDLYPNSSTIKNMWDGLSQKTGYSKPEIVEKSQEVLRTLLHSYDDFSVRTIDSFVSRIIRTFANDLHLPVDFEIEMDKDVLLDEAVDRLIAKAGLDDEITRILLEFTESKAEDEKNWHIESDFKTVGGYLFSEDGYAVSGKLKLISPSDILSIVKSIKSFRKSFESRLSVPAGKALDLIRSNGINLESFFYGKSGIGVYFNNIYNVKIGAPNSRVLTTVEHGSWFAAKAEVDQKNAIIAIQSQLAEFYQEIAGEIDRNLTGYSLLGMVSRQIFQLGVISALEKELNDIKTERRILHVSEFNKLITDIIMNEPVPFIYERTGEKYRNYLIDEFQDTSELQWKNLLPLLTDSLATDNFNLVVGDGKQAIYRFRNGEVEQFMLLPSLPASFDREVFGEAAFALERNFKQELLQNNFRSLPGVINFNNAFFRFIADILPPALRPIYADVEQASLPGKKGGSVTIDFLEYNGQEEARELNFMRIRGLIDSLLADGYCLNDLVVLTRSNLQGSLIARFLMGEGISVISAEALLLSVSPEVNLLVSALRLLNTPQDEVSAAALLIFLQQRGALPVSNFEIGSYAKNKAAVHFLQDSGFSFEPGRLLGLTIYDLCEELVRIFGLHEGPYDPYVQFFLEFVSKCSSTGINQLADLLEAWEEKKDKLSVVVPEGVDAVRIMTIHKSKGLEFPVVIWPFATDNQKNTRNHIWVEPTHEALKGLPVALLGTSSELETVGYPEEYQDERNKSLLDMLNLIYVAFTRASDRLYIITRQAGSSKSESVNLQGLLSNFIMQSTLEYRNEGTAVVFGENLKNSRADKGDSPSGEIVGSMISAAWQNRILIAKRAPIGWSTDTSYDSVEWGSLVHDTLALVRDSSDLEPALEKIAQSYDLDGKHASDLRAQLSAMVDHPFLRPYFTVGIKCRNEAEILTPEAKIFRPDRVVWLDSEVAIIEYKTGQPKEAHARQLNGYGEELGRMGYEKIRKFLVYLDNKIEVLEID
ncbi:MAG: UvrD-helicase domain-containing protein [Bacteroidales bacterium]|nr:UvrD-helicase domain-containing protein [Bacteroidales bacterium]